MLANKKLFGPVGRVEADRDAAFTAVAGARAGRADRAGGDGGAGRGRRAGRWLAGRSAVEATGPVPELW